MEALISVVGSLAGKAAEYTVDPIAQQLSYLFKHESKLQKLRDQLEDLNDAKVIVETSVLAAARNGEVILFNVDNWLDKVKTRISDLTETPLKEDEEKAKKKCLVGLCPNFKSRYQLSKKADKEVNAIDELLKQKDQFNGVFAFRPPPQQVTVLECWRPVEDFEDFESRNAALKVVMEALADDDYRTIGVYGMGGVGKTTLVNEVTVQASKKKMFQEVVLVTVKQTPNKENFQNEIAEQLGLKFDFRSSTMRASQLHDRLIQKKDQKVLIVLDDIWEPLNLKALGIPSSREYKGCKILMTSRNLDVLKKMDSEKNVAIDILTPDEAWNLFKKMAGDIIERTPALESIAYEVSQKCAGLPIAIATVAKSLKHKANLFEWKLALKELKTPSEVLFKGISGDVYSAIELSYKFLADEEVQLTFLLCSIMDPDDAAIEDLLTYVRGLGLFRRFDTIEDVRNKVSTLVSNFKESSLLLPCSSTFYTDMAERFDMHDVVRDVAISIASRDHRWLALGGDDVFEKYWSDKETMKNCNLLRLQYAKVSELADGFECPNLTFFYIMGEYEDCSQEILDNFLRRMPKLKVLVFSRMQFSTLPSSIRYLKYISTLCFFDCELKDITLIGELKNLEILSLHDSEIAMLPVEIGELRKLKLLDLRRCRNLEVISPGVLSKLGNLEELYLDYSLNESRMRSSASPVELQNLSHLTTLQVRIPSVQALPNDVLLFLGKLNRFKNSIGGKWNWDVDDLPEALRMLMLDTMKSIHLCDEVKTLLREIEILHLRRVDWEAIYCGENLTILRINSCDKLRFLFTSSMVSSLKQLKRVEIEDCTKMEEVILVEEAERSTTVMVFHKLHYMKLRKLPILKGFCSANIPVDFPMLKELKMRDCPVLKTFHCDSTTSVGNEAESLSMDHKHISHYLFNEKVAVPMLEIFLIDDMPNLERIWEPNQFACQQSFFKLIDFVVARCPNLVNIFPVNMMSRLERLKNLEIYQCKSLKEIFEYSEQSTAEQSSITFKFPQLIKLSLWELPKLKSLYHKMHTASWPSLIEMKVVQCEKVDTLFASELEITRCDHEIPIQRPLFWVNEFTFQNLEKITFSGNIKVIWQSGYEYDQQLQLSFLSHYFSKLRFLCFKLLPKELTTFPYEYIRFILSLPNLERLEISRSNFKEIFQSESKSEEEESNLVVGGDQNPTSSSPSPWVLRCSRLLTQLRLCYLSELMHLWKEKAAFPNLRLLCVDGCPKLNGNFVSSSVSFHNLATLEVTRCNGITTLVTHSTAKTLVQLKQMKIRHCNNIEEIIQGGDSDDDEEMKDEISFPNLQTLELLGLPKLESFCSSGNFTFGFPSLPEVQVKACPKMKMFSQGESNTPMLRKVIFAKNYWELGSGIISSSNSIQQQFQEWNKKVEDDGQTEDEGNSSTSNTQVGHFSYISTK